MDKFLYFNELYSIYQDLLTPNEQSIFALYYEENNSMGEIALVKKISRSAVGKTIKIVENKLVKYESILHNNEIKKSLLKIADEVTDSVIKDALTTLIQ